jgi:hypothetical protein
VSQSLTLFRCSKQQTIRKGPLTSRHPSKPPSFNKITTITTKIIFNFSQIFNLLDIVCSLSRLMTMIMTRPCARACAPAQRLFPQRLHWKLFYDERQDVLQRVWAVGLFDMSTPSTATPVSGLSGGQTPMAVSTPTAGGPMASLLASAEKFASASISPDERYKVVCEIREIASDLAISHEYPNFLSRFVPLFDDYLHKDVRGPSCITPLPMRPQPSLLCYQQSVRWFLVHQNTSTRKRACASWTSSTSTCPLTRACGPTPVSSAF